MVNAIEIAERTGVLDQAVAKVEAVITADRVMDDWAKMCETDHSDCVGVG